ncbi:MAG: HpcH/HpaI aldolase family protein [Vicinamibacteraceae bacterium]
MNEIEQAITFRAKLRNGECRLGAQISLSDPAIVEILGRAGFDWMVVDTEHAAQNIETVKQMLRTAMATSAVLLVRLLRLDPDEIRRYLDIGSPGVLCPFINNGSEAARLVEYCRYPPIGIRGWGARRVAVCGFDADEYLTTANNAVLCIPIIESAAAIEQIDDIVSVDGIDAVTVGPMDLSMSLGCFRQFDDPLYVAAVETVRSACKRHGKVLGTGCYSVEHAKECARRGDGLLLIAGDQEYLASESRRCIGEMRTVLMTKTV